MSSETQLKIFKLFVALLPYIVVPAIVVFAAIGWKSKIALVVVVLGPILINDLKQENFKV